MRTINSPGMTIEKSVWVDNFPVSVEFAFGETLEVPAVLASVPMIDIILKVLVEQLQITDQEDAEECFKLDYALLHGEDELKGLKEVECLYKGAFGDYIKTQFFQSLGWLALQYGIQIIMPKM